MFGCLTAIIDDAPDALLHNGHSELCMPGIDHKEKGLIQDSRHDPHVIKESPARN